MSQRPEDWSALGLSGDPTPGDPGRLAVAAESLAKVAQASSAIGDAMGRMLAVLTTGGLSGATFSAFENQLSGHALKFMAAAVGAFGKAAAAVNVYQTSMTAQQQIADAALAKARLSGLPADDPRVRAWSSEAVLAGEELTAISNAAGMALDAVAQPAAPWISGVLPRPELVSASDERLSPGQTMASAWLKLMFTIEKNEIVLLSMKDLFWIDAFGTGRGVRWDPLSSPSQDAGLPPVSPNPVPSLVPTLQFAPDPGRSGLHIPVVSGPGTAETGFSRPGELRQVRPSIVTAHASVPGAAPDLAGPSPHGGPVAVPRAVHLPDLGFGAGPHAAAAGPGTGFDRMHLKADIGRLLPPGSAASAHADGALDLRVPAELRNVYDGTSVVARFNDALIVLRAPGPVAANPASAAVGGMSGMSGMSGIEAVGATSAQQSVPPAPARGLQLDVSALPGIADVPSAASIGAAEVPLPLGSVSELLAGLQSILIGRAERPPTVGLEQAVTSIARADAFALLDPPTGGTAAPADTADPHAQPAADAGATRTAGAGEAGAGTVGTFAGESESAVSSQSPAGSAAGLGLDVGALADAGVPGVLGAQANRLVVPWTSNTAPPHGHHAAEAETRSTGPDRVAAGSAAEIGTVSAAAPESESEFASAADEQPPCAGAAGSRLDDAAAALSLLATDPVPTRADQEA